MADNPVELQDMRHVCHIKVFLLRRQLGDGPAEVIYRPFRVRGIAGLFYSRGTDCLVVLR